VAFHAARWGLLLLPALAARLAYPPIVTSGGPLRLWLGPLLYNLVILAIFWLLLALYRRETYRQLREMVFFAALFTLSIILADLLDGLFPARAEPLPIPLAAILVTLLYNGRIAITCAITLAFLLGTQGGQTDAATLFFGVAGGVAGALGMRVVRRRSQVLLNIAAITLAYTIAAVSFGLMAGWTGNDMLRSAGVGAVVALVSTSVAMALLPLAEWLTRITTDLRLLELADPARPLLKRLATEAPGTWAHSLQMANLCEVACNAIGANGLLARVGCYYHDVGKLVSPQHFVENQQGGRNPHDALPPLESADIIRQHVTYGLELADQFRLPEAVRRFIAEHHGTSRMEYFFEQARGPGAAGTADEHAFEYPGPRPSTGETAVAMLADSAEASVRVLDDPTPDRVKEAVDHLISRKIASGQLRDAPLTLQDLDRVSREFARLLASMYHTRIEYPSSAGGITAAFGRS
jgi:putative nucleotidyltransferase with HDIG domain